MGPRMGSLLLLALGACWALAPAASAQTAGDVFTLNSFFQNGRWFIIGAVVGALIGGIIGHFHRHTGGSRVAFGAAGGLAGGSIGGLLGSVFGWTAGAFFDSPGMQTLLGLLGSALIGTYGGYRASRYDQRVHEEIVTFEDTYNPPSAGIKPEHVDEEGNPLD